MINRTNELMHYQNQPIANTQSDENFATTQNRLLTAASTLLLLIIQLRRTNDCKNSNKLHKQLLEEIYLFEAKATSFGCAPRTILAARYCLCTALDEVVLRTSWGEENQWGRRTLLSLLHKETWGGENFFTILDQMAQPHENNIELLELLYIILSLGFEGKFYNQDKMLRDEIRHRLFHRLMQYRPYHQLQLRDKPKVHQQENRPVKPISRRTIFVSLFALLFIIALILNFSMEHMAKPVIKQLSSIGRVSTVYSEKDHQRQDKFIIHAKEDNS